MTTTPLADDASAAPALGGLDLAQLTRMAAAGRAIAHCAQLLADLNSSLPGELLDGKTEMVEWRHYPEGDVIDHLSHALYYYHAHPYPQRGDEHGHFHAFLGARGLPDSIRPLPSPAAADAPCHLAAIAIDGAGRPSALFATNRWVTDEAWYSGTDLRAVLDRFRINHGRPSGVVNRWLCAMLVLFRPQLEMLLHRRDLAIAEHRRVQSSEAALEDKRIEVLARVPIDVAKQIAAVESALRAAKAKRRRRAGQ